jgi:hypothetical protein
VCSIAHVERWAAFVLDGRTIHTTADAYLRGCVKRGDGPANWTPPQPRRQPAREQRAASRLSARKGTAAAAPRTKGKSAATVEAALLRRKLKRPGEFDADQRQAIADEVAAYREQGYAMAGVFATVAEKWETSRNAVQEFDAQGRSAREQGLTIAEAERKRRAEIERRRAERLQRAAS